MFVDCILKEMKKHILIVIVAIVLLPSLADAQQWKRYRKQVIGGVGVTSFLGNLGGGPGGNPANDFRDPFEPDRNDLVGEIRGNPDNNDSFMTVMISVSRKIVKRRRSRPKF